MELNREIITTPPRAAATVAMLRDSSDGLEVFLMQRHGKSDVLGGAYVFPGGKVDTADAELDMAAHLDQDLHTLHTSLNETNIDPLKAAGLYVAAMREVFEESGVLFARAGGPDSVNVVESFAANLKQGCSFNDALARMALCLQTRHLVPWSRWITPTSPSVMNKRFDTRFFVASVPSGQIARHDDFETTESVWLHPRAALEQYWAGQIEMAPPQIMSLAHLTHYADVSGVLDAARRAGPRLIQPEPFEHEGTRVICYPGDERHSVRERAMPGPTRLRYRNKRFEPEGGFEELFA